MKKFVNLKKNVLQQTQKMNILSRPVSLPTDFFRNEKPLGSGNWARVYGPYKHADIVRFLSNYPLTDEKGSFQKNNDNDPNQYVIRLSNGDLSETSRIALDFLETQVSEEERQHFITPLIIGTIARIMFMRYFQVQKYGGESVSVIRSGQKEVSMRVIVSIVQSFLSIAKTCLALLQEKNILITDLKLENMTILCFSSDGLVVSDPKEASSAIVQLIDLQFYRLGDFMAMTSKRTAPPQFYHSSMLPNWFVRVLYRILFLKGDRRLLREESNRNDNAQTIFHKIGRFCIVYPLFCVELAAILKNNVKNDDVIIEEYNNVLIRPFLDERHGRWRLSSKQINYVLSTIAYFFYLGPVPNMEVFDQGFETPPVERHILSLSIAVLGMTFAGCAATVTYRSLRSRK